MAFLRLGVSGSWFSMFTVSRDRVFEVRGFPYGFSRFRVLRYKVFPYDVSRFGVCLTGFRGAGCRVLGFRSGLCVSEF